MEYLLRYGKKVIIRKPNVEDAEAIINVMTFADTETTKGFNFFKFS